MGKIQMASKSSSVDTSSGKNFQNVGLARWEAGRAQWKKPAVGQKATERRGEVRSKSLDVDAVIEHVFSQPLTGQLPQPVPLGQMIDILIDFWEADGLYD